MLTLHQFRAILRGVDPKSETFPDPDEKNPTLILAAGQSRLTSSDRRIKSEDVQLDSPRRTPQPMLKELEMLSLLDGGSVRFFASSNILEPMLIDRSIES